MGKNKTTRRTLRQPLETGGFLLLKIVIPILPRWAVIALARCAGRLSMLLPLREKRIGMQNLDAVFGDTKDRAEKRNILRISYATFCQTMLDVFWFSRNPEKRIRRYVDVEDTPLLHAFLEDKPFMIITAHMGSWEMIGQQFALMGIDLASIAATIKNPTVDRVLIAHRQRTGQTIIPQKGALKTLIGRFRKNGKVGFVLDQNTSEKDGGIIVDFLGLPMPVSSAPAALAYRTGTPIVLVFCLPETGGRYRMCMTQRIDPPPFRKDADADQVIHAFTQRIMDGVSEQIRAYPQYWLWSYKHWRRREGRSYPDHYPSY